MTQPIGPPGSDGRWNIPSPRGDRVTHTHASATSSGPWSASPRRPPSRRRPPRRPSASAAASPTCTSTAATAAALGDLGLSVAPVGPATASGTRVSFPVTGGAIDPATAAGRVAHSGGLAFSAGGTTVRVTDFVVRTDRKQPVLTAAVGSARVPLLALDLRDAKVLRRGPGGVGTWVVRVQTSLTATAAGALNGAFGSHLAAGTPDRPRRPPDRAVRGGARGRRDDARPRPRHGGRPHRPRRDAVRHRARHSRRRRPVVPGDRRYARRGHVRRHDRPLRRHRPDRGGDPGGAHGTSASRWTGRRS